MVKVTQELFDEIKSNKNVSLKDISSKYGISIATASRIVGSETLDEYKKKGHHKKATETQPSVVNRTEYKKSVTTTTVKGNQATVTIKPKLSLLDRIIKLLKRER
jgi:transposase